MPSNDYYDSTGWPSDSALISARSFRAEFDAIEEGFKKLPDPSVSNLPVFTTGTGLTTKTAEQARTLLGVPSTSDLPSYSNAGGDKVVGTNTNGNDWEYFSITAAGKALLDDASASAQLTTLGVTASGKALLDDASADEQLTTLGITAAGKALLDDDSASEQLTTLGLTEAGKALVDDASAADQRVTLGLGNVNNTSDANKPISSATQSALNAKFDASKVIKGTGAYTYVGVDGVIIQGGITTTSGNPTSVFFPTAFPTGVISIVATARASSDTLWTHGGDTLGFFVNSSGTGTVVSWIALGY